MNFLEELKEELALMSDETIMITVKRKNVEVLIKQYERLLFEKEAAAHAQDEG